MDKDIQDRLVQSWLTISKNWELKPGTKTYDKFERMFFAGVLEALGQQANPGWVMLLLCGRSISEFHAQMLAKAAASEGKDAVVS